MLFDCNRLLPQNSGFKLYGPGFSDKQMGILVDSLRTIKEDDCTNFINETLAKYKVGKEFNSLDKLLNKATLGRYDVNADYTNSDLGIDIHGTILLRDAYVNRGASAVTYGTHVLLSDKVFDRTDYYLGGIKFVQDQSTNALPITDRAYSYDHAGRLAEAYSGAQARRGKDWGQACDFAILQSFGGCKLCLPVQQNSWLQYRRQEVLTDNCGRASIRGPWRAKLALKSRAVCIM
jgi:hypothetical protein